MPLRISVFEVSKSVSTKTLLLKHYCRHQGFCVCKVVVLFWRDVSPGGFKALQGDDNLRLTSSEKENVSPLYHSKARW